MKVQILPADKAGCAYYRCHLPAEFVGVDVVVNDEIISKRRTQDGPIADADPAVEDADVLVIQRPLKKDIVDCIPFLKAKGIAIVVENDDDLHAVPRDNAAWAKIQPKYDPEHNIAHFARATQLADVVTVSTPALDERYGRGKGVVIPNYIHPDWLDIQGKKFPTLSVGWSGNHIMHPHDLQEARGVLGSLMRHHDFQYVNVGSSPESADVLGAPDERAVIIDWSPMEDYPKQVARFDIGMVPLHDSRFNTSKSWLKGLEYMALGVPFVASARAEYVRLMQVVGGGFSLARKPRDWEKMLANLITNQGLRETMAATGREAARELTIDKHAWRYVEAWALALTKVRGKAA